MLLEGFGFTRLCGARMNQGFLAHIVFNPVGPVGFGRRAEKITTFSIISETFGAVISVAKRDGYIIGQCNPVAVDDLGAWIQK